MKVLKDKQSTSKSSIALTLEKDKEFAESLEMVQQNGKALRYLSEDLKDNDQIAKAACYNTIRAYNFVSDRLKRDRPFLIDCLNHSKQFAINDAIRNTEIEYFHLLDKEVALACVINDSSCFSHLPDEMKASKEVIERAIKSDATPFRSIPSDLMEDVDFCISSLAINPGICSRVADNVAQDHRFLKALYNTSIIETFLMIQDVVNNNLWTKEFADPIFKFIYDQHRTDSFYKDVLCDIEKYTSEVLPYNNGATNQTEVVEMMVNHIFMKMTLNGLNSLHLNKERLRDWSEVVEDALSKAKGYKETMELPQNNGAKMKCKLRRVLHS